jgi:hypothetical protein
MNSLAGLSRVVIEFSPASPASRAAREFWARVSCARARAAWPDCDVQAVRLPDPGAHPRVTVELAGDGKASGGARVRECLDVSGLTAVQVAARVAAVGAGGAAGGPAAAVVGKGGGPPPKLDSGWGAGEVAAGVAAKVPVGSASK